MGDENPTEDGEVISGRVTEVLRVGDTVRRPLNDSTESMRQLLVHLERVDFEGDPLVRDWPAPPNRAERNAALVRGYRLHPSEAHQLADMVVEVIAGCHRSVAHKAAAEIPAFVRLRDEGVLDDLDNQREAVEHYRSLIVDAALEGIP